MRLKRKIFWYEEQLMKYADYDKIKTRNTDLMRQKERLQIELKELEKKYQEVWTLRIITGLIFSNRKKNKMIRLSLNLTS